MMAMQIVMDLGRSARERRGISLKTPVKGITVVCKDEAILKALEKLQSYVKGELNAWEVWKHFRFIFSRCKFRVFDWIRGGLCICSQSGLTRWKQLVLRTWY